MKICPKCGFVIENDQAKFCRHCGTNVECVATDKKEEPVAEPMPAPEPVMQEMPVPTPPEMPRREESSMWKWVLLGVGIIGVCVLGLVLSLQIKSGDSYANDDEDDSDNEAYVEEVDTYVPDTTKADTAVIIDRETPLEEEPVRDVVVDNSLLPDGYCQLDGDFIDTDGTRYPVGITFNKRNGSISNCVYTNKSFGGKIHMSASTDGDDLYFYGRDGNNDFTISCHTNYNGTWSGVARDGNKELRVELSL